MKDARDMSFSELKAWLRDRLQMRGAAAADVSIRRDEAPYEKPVQLWKSGGDEFRNDFKRAVLDLVGEAGTTPWQPAGFHELGLLIEAASLWESVRPLEEVARSRRLSQQRDGPQLQMLALRTLLALGWKGTVDFWLAQKDLVGARWPGIIFEGLAQQDVDLAFGRLPDLVADRKGMQEVLNLLPGLMRDLKLGIATLREKCRRVVGKLPPEASKAMRDWFCLRDCPLQAGANRVNASLVVALQGVLGKDSQPRRFSPTLCGSRTEECVPA